MKTNVTMKSNNRILFGVNIRQDTKNQFLSVTDLQEAYTHARVEKGWNDKRISDILSNLSSLERIYYILEKQGIIKTGFSAFMEEAQKETTVGILKKYGVSVYISASCFRT